MKKDKIVNILTSKGVVATVAIAAGVMGGAYGGVAYNQNKNDAIIENKNETIVELNNNITELKSKEANLTESNDTLKSEIESLNSEKQEISDKLSEVTQENNKLTNMLGLKKNSQGKVNSQKVLIEVSAYYTGEPGVGTITASGKTVQIGHIAAPPEIPFGTKVIIDGFNQTFEVTDRGGYIKKVYNNAGEPVYRVDIYVNNHAEAEAIGRKVVEGYFIYE